MLVAIHMPDTSLGLQPLRPLRAPALGRRAIVAVPPPPRCCVLRGRLDSSAVSVLAKAVDRLASHRRHETRVNARSDSNHTATGRTLHCTDSFG